MSEEILINGKKITELSDMFFEYCKLKKENEKLKENQCCPETCEYIATEIIRYANVCEVNSKYKQALEKIREIAKYNQFYNPNYFMLRGDIGQIQNIKMTEIYKKCNEVLNEQK